MSRTDKETLSQWITEARENGRGLTKWEEDFLDSVKEQLEERGSLTEKQVDILERIYTEKTPL